MSFLVATNVVASRPPERRPTGMPHARAKKLALCYYHEVTAHLYWGSFIEVVVVNIVVVVVFVIVVVVNVVVVALLVVTDHIIFSCGQSMLIWGALSW